MRICILDDLENAALASADWSQLVSFANITVMNEPIIGEANLIDALQDFDIIVLMRERTPISRLVVESLSKLKLIVTTGMRNASIDISACHERGVVISGTGNGPMSVVELAWAYIFAASKRVHEHDADMKAGYWLPTQTSQLSGKTLGLLGFGNTGKKMAKIGRAFDMEIIAWSQNLSSVEANQNMTTLVSKDELFQKSDFLSIHLVLSDRTGGLVGEEDLAKMKKESWLINTSRGPICDEQALVKASSEGWIGGVALDVFDKEPLPADHRIRSVSHSLLTPHLGYVTSDNFQLWYSQVIEDILAFFLGAPIRVVL